MSYLLWKFYFEDDAESFCQLLGEAGIAGRPAAQKSHLHEPAYKVTTISPLALSSSVGTKSSTHTGLKSQLVFDRSQFRFNDVTLTRADINRRDSKGLTLLHHAASSENENAKAFALALIAHPLIDVHMQDLENGWNALHRAFYFGNISIARAILAKESQDAVGPAGLTVQAASLIKTKDWEGNGPWDILTATIKDRTLKHFHVGARNAQNPDEEDDPDIDSASENHAESMRKGSVEPHIDLKGDELFTFGSNKNFNLGLNNQDDRYFPERAKLSRPNYLFRRFHREHVELRVARLKGLSPHYAAKLESELYQDDENYAPPAIVRSKPVSIQDVQMAKFHTAVLTNDPFPNLYLCGHALGGRLGVGDEKTRFNLVCIEDFGSLRRRIIAVALGQDHTLAVTDQGDLFAWGSNTFGQLGLGFSRNDVKTEEPACLAPKKIYGPLKREIIVGVAASRIHSVAHTTTALYTFGKNEGQLGIVDAQSGSLKFQPIPRRVAASRFSHSILSVSAIDRATVCLLENHEVHVFANYGIVKLMFPLDQFANPLSEKSDTATRYDATMPSITKVTCGGDTICALSNAGEIFAVTVDQRLDPISSGTASTTKPNKIRHALSQPARIWTLKKGHMSAMDVAVDQDDSVVITTEAGSVWTRQHRASLATARSSHQSEKKPKEFKISRVPGLTRVIAVRASSSGACAAIRNECDVTKFPIAAPDGKTLWKDMADLLPFRNLGGGGETMPDDHGLTHLDLLKTNICQCEDLEKEVASTLRYNQNHLASDPDAFVKTSICNVQIPVHAFVFAGRSKVLRDIFSSCRSGREYSDDVMSVTRSKEGQIVLTLKGFDFSTVVELVLYLYTDHFAGFWMHTRQTPSLSYRYRQIRLELLKISTKLDLRGLDSTWKRTLDKDLELAVADQRFFEDADATVQLQDGEVLVHSAFLSRRCPFFEELFQGSAAGRWLEDRRNALQSPDEKVSVDLTHIEQHVFQLVLRHMYADTGEELFDEIVSKDLDEFLDLILDVLSVANELMLDRLSQICQELLGRYVTTRNVCQLLNAVAPCAITQFKDSALEFICLNLEAMLSNHLLDELDEDLMDELDLVVQDNQLNSLPFAKSGRADLLLYERHPGLAETMVKDKQAQLDRMIVYSKYSDQHWRSPGTSLNVEYQEKVTSAKTNARKQSFNQSNPKALLKSTLHSSEDGQVEKDYFGSPLRTPGNTPLLNANSENVIKASSSPSFALPSPSIDTNIAAEGKQASLTSFAQEPPETVEPGSSAWGKLPLSSGKLGIKDIMAQASSFKVSNLSLGFAAEAKSKEPKHISSQPKMSQKERRRQQQQYREAENTLETVTAPETSSTGSQLSAKPQSPWRTVSSPSKPVVQQSPSQSLEPPNRAIPNISRTSTTPQLTMRQTIANSPSLPQSRKESIQTPPQTPKPHRAVSTPQSSASKPNSAGMSGESSSGPVEIQSIRHIPRETSQMSPTSQRHYSLADIFSQQAAEKNVAKEAVAKRSLQEIQQEQEFQQWWDQESRKVMEEEAAAARVAARETGGRGRGRGRGSRRTRGKGKETQQLNP